MTVTITIDGPAGAGKTDTAQQVAMKLNLTHYNSGYTYRGITYALIRDKLINEDFLSPNIQNYVESLKLVNTGSEIYLDKLNVTHLLRSPIVEEKVSFVSKHSFIRNKAKKVLTNFVSLSKGLVVEGRDIGTVVLPNADVKIFLTASLDARTKRRLSQSGLVDYESVYVKVKERDEMDKTRTIAPLLRAEDSYLVDNSELSLEETVQLIVGIVRGKMNFKN